MKISKVSLSVHDLVPIIQRRGDEQGKEVNGKYSHYAYEQANLLLLAEDMFDVLSRIVKNGMSTALKSEAVGLIERVRHNQY